MAKARNFKGFTLIEILVVVALIAILTAITFIAINPAKNFEDTRNAQRSSDVTQILNAVTQYTSEQGHLLSDLGTIPLCDAVAPSPTAVEIGSAALDLGDTAGPLVDEYIVGMPVDPSDSDDANTGYWICQTDGGRIQVSAPNTENRPTPISVKR